MQDDYLCYFNTELYFLWHLLGIDILKMGGNILTTFELGEENAS